MEKGGRRERHVGNGGGAPGTAQVVAHRAVGPQLEALEGERLPGGVANDAQERLAVVGGKATLTVPAGALRILEARF